MWAQVAIVIGILVLGVLGSKEDSTTTAKSAAAKRDKPAATTTTQTTAGVSTDAVEEGKDAKEAARAQYVADKAAYDAALARYNTDLAAWNARRDAYVAGKTASLVGPKAAQLANLKARDAAITARLAAIETRQNQLFARSQANSDRTMADYDGPNPNSEANFNLRNKLAADDVVIQAELAKLTAEQTRLADEQLGFGGKESLSRQISNLEYAVSQATATIPDYSTVEPQPQPPGPPPVDPDAPPGSAPAAGDTNYANRGDEEIPGAGGWTCDGLAFEIRHQLEQIREAESGFVRRPEKAAKARAALDRAKELNLQYCGGNSASWGR